LVIIINFGGRRILLTGDAPANLFTELFSEHRNKLRHSDIMLLPHHGTDQNGELSCFYSIMPELSIVSSSPYGADNIPWEAVNRLAFKETNNYVQLHNISFRNIVAASPTKKVTTATTANPLFVTHNSTDFYYKTTITSNGTITLQDGEGIPQFCSFNADLSAKDRVKEIVTETRKYMGSPTTDYCKWLITQLKLSITGIHNFKEQFDALSLLGDVFEAILAKFFVNQGVITDLENALYQCWGVQYLGDNSLDRMIDWLVQQIKKDDARNLYALSGNKDWEDFLRNHKFTIARMRLDN
jgi:hypothetical protein